MTTPQPLCANVHRVVRGTALGALLLFLACGEDGDHYAPLGNDETPRATVVAGLVRDAGKDAVTDALVVIEPATHGVPASAGFLSKNPDAPSASTPDRRVTTTNSRGRFAFEDVDAGDYFLQVIADDHLGAMHSIKVPDPMAFVDTVYVDVNLTPTGTFSGVATLENAGSHQGTVVYVEGTSYVAVTDPSGDYAITNVPVGSYTVRAEHPNYLEDTENGTITTAGEDVPLASMLLKLNSNIPPVANIVSASPLYQAVPVDFLASGSDADGSVVLYEWDWEDDGTFDYSDNSSANASHPYPAPGAYTAKLRVTDDDGAIGLAVIQLAVVANPPNRVYMATTGSDLNDGSITSPVATISKAYQIAQLEGKDQILIEQGGYPGQVPIILPGIDLLGSRILPTWEEELGYSSFSYSNARATANNITSPTEIRFLAFTLLANGPSNRQSIALYSSGSDGDLSFYACRFQTVNGQTGNMGVGGANGTAGGIGFPGSPGSCDGSNGGGGAGGNSIAGCFGGQGGSGGPEGANNGQTGQAGLCIMPGGGGSGGTGASAPLICNVAGNPGANGGSGQAGTPGNPGTPGSATGSVVGGEWFPISSTNGTSGAPGAGAGGGGGGGGQGGAGCDDGGGNGGGGGGGGGDGGFRGTGGGGGWSSFCVMLFNSSPTFTGSNFFRGFGGGGGVGGPGGNGGNGGSGGAGAAACLAEVGRGGNGGTGGAGGNGGGGAGGPGGPCFGIYRAGTSVPSVISCTFADGGPGTGGAGGSGAPSGPAGLFGSVN